MDRRPPSRRAGFVAVAVLLAASVLASPFAPRATAREDAVMPRAPRAVATRAAPRLARPADRPPAAATPVAASAPPRSTCGVDVVQAGLPAGVEAAFDVSYGPDRRQTFDVYYPSPYMPGKRPVLVMVHGGGWREGDKRIDNVWRNKVAWWVPRGWIVVSVNYRLIPDAYPLDQARDVAAAVARAQQLVPVWNGDPERFVLMGHSAGAHLVALLDADVTLASSRGVLPWRATVALDSAAYDVPRIMRAPHPSLYDDAFGTDPAAWPVASPIDRLHAGGAPLLGVCSSLRAESCPQANDFAVAARGVGTSMTVVPEALSHEQINETLGLPGAYTDTVDRFIADAVR